MIVEKMPRLAGAARERAVGAVVSTAEPAAPTPAEGMAAPRASALLALQARALGYDRFRPAAIAVVAELARLARCERVSLGLPVRGSLRLAAVSVQADVRAERTLVRAVVAAMEESLEQRILLVEPLPPSAAPTISLAQAELIRIGGYAAVCTVPILGRERALGALVFERRDGFDAATLELIRDAAMFVGPVLALQHRVEAPIGSRLGDSRNAQGRLHPGFERRPRRLVPLAFAAAALIIACWPVTDHAVAEARVEGETQRVIAAPVDGFVKAVPLRPGDRVTAGQLLLTLEDHDLALERDRWNAESAQLDKLYREALSKDDAAQIVIARSKLEQARTQLDLAERQLERSQLLAPFDGVVTSGDLTQSVGIPVKRGQELMTVAPAVGFRAVAEVDEQDVTALRTGLAARVLFAGGGPAVSFTVERIAPVAVALGGRNVFEVEGRLDASDDRLRPGLRGVARIAIERRVVAAIVWQRLADWVRRTTWRVLG